MAYIPLLSDIFGQKPDVAGFKDVDLGESQMQAILENLKAFSSGKIPELGNLYQKYMTGLYENLIPNFSDLLKQGGETSGKMLDVAGQELEGEVPQDVQDFVRRQTAFQNMGSGLFGGAMGAANWARNLGLTSLDMTQKGAQMAGAAGNAAQRWASLAQGTMLPASSFLLNPEQQFQATTQNRLIQRQVQQERNNVAAAPNPIAKGLSDLVAYLTASYIGHGPAGKPPDAPKYDAGGGAMSGAGAGSNWSDVTTPGHYTGSASNIQPPDDIYGYGEGNYPPMDTFSSDLVNQSDVPLYGSNPGPYAGGYTFPYQQNLYGVSDFNVNPNQGY